MGTVTIYSFVREWPVLLPQLSIYSAGIIIALVNWRVCRLSAALMLAAMVIFILTVIFQIPLTAHLDDLRLNGGYKTPQFLLTRSFITFCIGSMRAIGAILTLFAAFQGRRPPPLP